MGNIVLGCDIGNGYGFVSFLETPEADPIPLFPTQYRLEQKGGMPTTAYLSPPAGNPVVVFSEGRSAEKAYPGQPEYFVHAVKTRLKYGDIPVPGSNQTVPPTVVYAAIARDLVLLANEQLRNRGSEPCCDIVFTFPASLADDIQILEQLQSSLQTQSPNGHPIQVRGRLPEPAAVAIDYLHYMQHIAPKEIRIKEDSYTVLVYDLGHGTFDSAVVTARSKGEPYQLHCKDGIPDIGGQNFDQIIYDEFYTILKDKYQYVPRSAREKEELRKKAVEAKHELTENEVSVQSILVKDDFQDIEITRERFEELSLGLILQTLDMVQRLLEEADEKGISVAGIVLSGGASRMPMVTRTLEEFMEGKLPVVIYRPSEAVSYGAARYAYGLAAAEEDTERHDLIPVLEQLTDCCYGIWTPSETHLEGEIRFVIAKGQRRPAVSDPVSVQIGSSGRISIRLYQTLHHKSMESASPDAVDSCKEVMRIPFDAAPNTTCSVRLTAAEDYSLLVELTTEQGTVISKNTFDTTEQLIR